MKIGLVIGRLNFNKKTMRIQKEKNRCFTLIELLMVIIILAILVSVGIPIYSRAIEDVRGKACQNNMRTIFAAWRIYNMREATDYDPAGGFRNVNQINTNLSTLVDERYFGNTYLNSYGFYMRLISAANSLYLSANRQSGIYSSAFINCFYFYNNGTYSWAGNWPFSLTE